MRDHTVRLRAVRRGVAGAAASAILVAGWSVAGPAGAAAAQEDPETTLPATTEAPTTSDPGTVTTGESPVTTAAPDGEPPTEPDAEPEPDAGTDADPAGQDEGEDEGGSSASWALAAAIAAAAVLVLAALVAVVAARRRRSTRSRAFNRRVAEVVGRAQWVHDEGSLEVLGATASPERLQAVWSDTRRRVDDVAAQASALAAQAVDEGSENRLRRLSHALGRLLEALDTHASLHLQLAGDVTVQAALEGATETVMQRRADLAGAIRPLAARI